MCTPSFDLREGWETTKNADFSISVVAGYQLTSLGKQVDFFVLLFTVPIRDEVVDGFILTSSFRKI